MSEPPAVAGGPGRSEEDSIQTLLLRHLRPHPRVGWGIVLGEERLAGAMIDISDGLSSDLAHLCRESNVGALIQSAQLPIDKDVIKLCGRRALDPLALALHGGEDFELVVADDIAAAGRELRYALERVSQRVIAEQVCELDNSIGLSVSRLIITKFNLLRTGQELDHEPLSPESAQSISLLKPPLTLAAHASTNAGEIFDVGVIPEESSENAQAEQAENIETELDSGPSWN